MARDKHRQALVSALSALITGMALAGAETKWRHDLHTAYVIMIGTAALSAVILLLVIIAANQTHSRPTEAYGYIEWISDPAILAHIGDSGRGYYFAEITNIQVTGPFVTPVAAVAYVRRGGRRPHLLMRVRDE